MITFILDEDLKKIIQSSNKSDSVIKTELRHTLYLLNYTNYEVGSEITEKEVSRINNYPNKLEFNLLFKILISDNKKIN